MILFYGSFGDHLVQRSKTMSAISEGDVMGNIPV